jgi:hypothetical protein
MPHRRPARPRSSPGPIPPAKIRRLFNSIDPSPFQEKDLDDDATEFIISWAKEFQANEALTLLVHLERAPVPPEAAGDLSLAVHSYFGHRSELTQMQLRQLLRTGRTSLVIGALFLAGCIVGGNGIATAYHQSEFAQVVQQSLLIGGWVAMWRPMEIFLYDWWPILRERRLYDRLGRMQVKIQCETKN